MERLSIVSIVVQILTFGALIFYTIATFKMASASKFSVNEMKKMREQEFFPYVVVYFDVPYGQHIIELVVKNIGKRPAKNVKMKISPPLVSSESKIDLGEVGFIKNGIKMLPPGYEIRTFVDTTSAYFDRRKELPLQYKVKVSWFCENEEQTTEWDLDLSIYYNRLSISGKGIHQLVEINEKIKRTLEGIENTLSGMNNILAEGLRVRNYIFPSNEVISLETWKCNILAVSNYYKTLWKSIYGKNDQKLVNPFYRNLRNVLVATSLEFLKIVANCPTGISEEIKNNLTEITKKLFDLCHFKFYIGPASVENFNKLGDEILEQIEKLLNDIEKL
ncbi:MAG: hypothetical protein ACK4F0_07935 [Candidatus Ratteibacteria bacterium]